MSRNEKKEMLFTGMGLVLPFAQTLDDYILNFPDFPSLKKHLVSLKDINQKDRDILDDHINCSINKALFSDIKGEKYLDKCTKLLYSAVRQFIKKDDKPAEDLEKMGISVGSTFSTLSDHMKFLLNFEKGGFRGLNPLLFPNTVYNCPASQLAIILRAKGPNITNCNGFCAGLDALTIGSNLINNGQTDQVIVAGVEENSWYINLVFLYSFNNHDIKGFLPVEAAGAILLESKEKANKRNAKIYGKILGYFQGFYPKRVYNENILSELIESIINRALNDSYITFDDIGSICLSINGIASMDRAELKAVGRLLQNTKNPKGLLALKKLIGETGGASGILQIITIFNDIDIPLDQHYKTFLPEDFIEAYQKMLSNNLKGKYALVNNLNWEGNFTATIVELN